MRCRASEAERRAFEEKLAPLAQAICPEYGLDPDECLRQAAERTDYGRFVFAHNYWEILGRGDAGSVLLLRPVFHGRRAGGGWRADQSRLARYSTPAAAVHAWCRLSTVGR